MVQFDMGMLTVGELLRKKRIAAGLSTSELASLLFVRESVIKDLENNNFARFKSHAIVRGLVKNYAREVGADVQQVLAVLRRQLGIKQPTITKIDKPVSTKSFQITPLHVGVVIISILVLALLVMLVKSYVKTLKYPSLTINYPNAKTITVSKDQVEISGVVEPGSILTINGINVNYGKTGKFSYKLDLAQGENSVVIIAKKRYDQDKKTIKKFLILYVPNKEQSQNNTSGASNATSVKPLNFKVKIKGGQAWIQIVVDNVQKVIGIKSDGYTKTFSVKKSVYIITGRPNITYVYANNTRIDWQTKNKTFRIDCNIENNVWICNNINIK